MKKGTFILIDGNAILHRAYHALPRFETNGQLVNALYGFISILFSFIERYQPQYLAVAFDVKGPTFRDELFDKYKAKRVKPPQEFYDQIPAVWEFLKTMEIPLLTREGYEADDIIGTIAKHVNGELSAGEVLIVTGDQDTLQLVDQRTKVAMPAMGKIRETVYDANAVQGKFGLAPAQIIDYKALCGDASDNIPGVPGIGDKTASALLKEFGNLEKVYEAVNQKPEEISEKFSPSVLTKLQAGQKSAELSQKLAKIIVNVELDFKLKDATIHDFDDEKVRKFLESYRFKSLVKRMPSSHREVNQQEKLF